MNQIKNLENILEKINVYRPFDVAMIIYNNYSMQLNDKLKNNLIQKGAGKVKLKYINFDDYEFVFEETEDRGLIFVKLYSHDDTRECIIIIIDPQINLSSIQGISSYPECVKDNLTQNGIGSLLLRASLEFLKQNKKIYNINRVILNDNSYKSCIGSDNIRLSNMYFLLYGNTWYGKYGFKPFDSLNDKPDYEAINEYKRSQKIINEMKVNDVPYLRNLIIESYNDIKPKNLHIENILFVLDKMKNKSLSKFLKVFLVHYDKTCRLFSKFYIKLYNKLNLYDFYKRTFYLDL